MQINKYTHHGKDVNHDVHYTMSGRICRFGSDEKPKERFQEAYEGINALACELADKTVRIKRVNWSRNQEKRETELKLECTASDIRGADMKVEISKIGYAQRHVEDETGRLVERTVPLQIEHHHLKTILEFESALAEYVRDGAGQLEFDFTEDLYNQTMEHPQNAGESIKNSGATSASLSIVNSEGEKQKIAQFK